HALEPRDELLALEPLEVGAVDGFRAPGEPEERLLVEEADDLLDRDVGEDVGVGVGQAGNGVGRQTADGGWGTEGAWGGALTLTLAQGERGACALPLALSKGERGASGPFQRGLDLGLALEDLEGVLLDALREGAALLGPAEAVYDLEAFEGVLGVEDAGG